MQITVRVNGVLAQTIGIARFPVTLSTPATIQDLLQHLQAQYPSLSVEIEQAVTVVSGVHKPATTLLQDGQEVALLMPIAGG
ncbi:MAG: MoaD/ThiS family protein [Anaerolineales bacterium]|nr:MoaD/ThiS family protein [Anaerolineales bacterium]MCA9930234.1 MoaD/ThiS family protein [Anaerolineales bacterium]